MNFSKSILTSIALFSFSIIGYCQTGNIRGFVYDQKDGEPMISATVVLEQQPGLGAATDLNGFYSITNVPAGAFNIICTAIGYDTAKIEVTVSNNDITQQTILLKPTTITLSEFTVNAKKEEKKNDPMVSMTKITSKDIHKIPSVGGEADLAQYLQVIPGIIFTGDQGGELYIRGGSPIQNKVLLDGMTIYNPFHSIGLFSVFETDIIKNVNVLTGGFDAQYGGRISAVVDIVTRDGNKKGFDGKISASPFQGRLLLEGPIKKLNADGAGSSFIFSAKSSYLDKTSKTFYSYIDTAGLPYNFNDLYGKMTFNSSNGSKISFFGFDYTDHVNYSATKFNWTERGFGTNFVIIPGSSKTIINGTVAFSNYNVAQQETDEKPRTSGINGYDIDLDFTYYINHGELKYGFDVGGFRTSFQFYNTLNIKIEQEQNTTEVAGYFLWRKSMGRLVIEPSFHLHYYASLPVVSPEPRFSAKFNLTENIRLKFATGLYSQNFISTKSDKDVVNLFTGFLTAPDGALIGLDGKQVNNNLQKAFHLIGGLEMDFIKNTEITIEPYYKNFTQLININRNKLLPEDPDFQIETGEAYGIDFLIKYDYKNLYLWTGYSLSYVTRNNGDQTYYPHFDRRHNANVVISYSFGKNKSWEVDARWNLGSGFPFTKTQGFYEFLNFSGGINTSYETGNGSLGIIYDSTLNTGRLPYYHRLDFTAKKKMTLSENVNLEIVGSVINVYDRENIFYFDRIRYVRVNQLPFLPAIGLSLNF